ncbi:hypothetical protein BT63DRAFT_461968 [Microthyrium microscopicum]|uniref:Heterokaryon incompatibility domain-containing protein n=1 Tax=Microthyrium microscopicum TaxID=703497 RepID=A0A6A6USC5_9PEZI|nr:hypothetical protein BT63DRAFT_461968 [Microthyrium microscopicum]
MPSRKYGFNDDLKVHVFFSPKWLSNILSGNKPRSSLGKANKHPHLCIPSVASWNPSDPFATSSHCWGSDSNQVARLEAVNLQTLIEKIDTSGLPQTFKNAIDITRLFGLRSLWTDSLCIIASTPSTGQFVRICKLDFTDHRVEEILAFFEDRIIVIS